MITFEVARQWNHSGLADAIERLVLPGSVTYMIFARHDICHHIWSCMIFAKQQIFSMLKMTIDSPRGKCRPQMPSQYKELLKSTAQVKRFFNAIKSLIAHLQKSLTNFWIDTQLNRWILSYDNNVILKLNWKWNQITKFSSPDKPDRCPSGLARSRRVFVAPHRMLAWKCPPLQVLLQGDQGDENQ